jgi:hypothetical protein
MRSVTILAAVLAVGYSKYVAIDEKDCTDSACEVCTDNGIFATNECLETTQKGLYIIGNCSEDGNSITEWTFSDPACSEGGRAYPAKANTCNQNAQGGYTLYTCETNMVRNYTSIHRQDCDEDNYCWACKETAAIATEKCILDADGAHYMRATCNKDGTTITKYVRSPFIRPLVIFFLSVIQSLHVTMNRTPQIQLLGRLVRGSNGQRNHREQQVRHARRRQQIRHLELLGGIKRHCISKHNVELQGYVLLILCSGQNDPQLSLVDRWTLPVVNVIPEKARARCEA